MPLRVCIECGTMLDVEGDQLFAGPLCLDRPTGRAIWRGRLLPHLEPREAELLAMLIIRQGKPIATDAFYIHLFGEDKSCKLLAAYISRLRAKFRRVDPEFDMIETILGFGYRWRIQREANQYGAESLSPLLSKGERA